MGYDTLPRRTAILRVDCGAVYAGERWPEKEISWLGTESDCRCGRTEFREITLSAGSSWTTECRWRQLRGGEQTAAASRERLA